ncbi:M48 family metalloprotease [Aquiluna borgnonia]|uniref:M48 family metalloprotease n=1 Tax=Aquiluna borgnonia TaxID=2499157 RepID=A0A7D4PWJ9_9MICO|nr:M48 family metalloprotease [Aquiluna borgnonia]QKJ24664.1 M48 family metalloprotease [Aquiluna borgnonia]
MESFYLLVILIEYVLLVTTSAPFLMANRFKKAPEFGIALWFTLFFTAMAAATSAVVIASWSVIETWYRLQANENLLFTIGASLAPWVMLALAGVLLAVSNQRLEPMFRAAKEFDLLSMLALREVESFHRAKVFELEVPGYLALTRGNEIYLSKAVFELPQRQLSAILWHEYGHIRLGHQRLKRFTALMMQLAPWFAVSRGFSYEIAKLCELTADNYALRRVYSKDLVEARRLFS